MSMKPIKVALLGIGTVGSGVFKVLQRNQAEIKARTGRGIEITLVADRAADHARSIVGNTTEVITDAFAAVTRPEIDIVLELIGGYTVAKELVLKAIENGNHVVTANKALLGTKEGITKLRGQWQHWRDIPVMPTYHPSYLLRPYNQDAKREAWEDLKKVLHYVYDEPPRPLSDF